MDESVIALDIGEKRIGIAIASTEAKLAIPLMTLNNDDNFLSNLESLIKENNVTGIVVGLPRDVNGNETNQTNYTRNLAEEISNATKLPTIFQDEAITSIRAKEELESRGKIYSKSDVDKLAASYILEDYLRGKS